MHLTMLGPPCLGNQMVCCPFVNDSFHSACLLGSLLHGVRLRESGVHDTDEGTEESTELPLGAGYTED
jgi:hypothetical protein